MRPWKCALGMHRVRRVHAFIGMNPTAAECPACGDVVPWSGPIDEGWVWRDHGEQYEMRVWLGGLNTKGPPEHRDLRDVYRVKYAAESENER